MKCTAVVRVCMYGRVIVRTRGETFSREFIMIRLAKSGASVSVCLQQPRQVERAGSGVNESLEMNNLYSSASFK